MNELALKISHPTLPSGAISVSDILSQDEEMSLVEALDAGVWDSSLHRRVQHFGYRYDYKARTIAAEDELGPLPDWLAAVAERLVVQGWFHALPDQVIANEYRPGQGISAHVDCVPCFGDTIASVSLLSTCEMIFRRKNSGAISSLLLRPRSVLILRGAARYDWTHEIPARKSDMIDGVRMVRGRRISLTFRKVLR